MKNRRITPDRRRKKPVRSVIALIVSVTALFSADDLYRLAKSFAWRAQCQREYQDLYPDAR